MYSILYVDDEVDLLDLGKTYLEEDPELTVDTVPSARQALGKIQDTGYDVIVSDYLMPEMNGIALLKEVRTRAIDIPFILFTGRGREEVVIDAINNGADFYLQKGGEPRAQFAELAHKIKKAAELKRERDAVRESEQRLADIINFLPDATFAIDTDGTVIAWNRAIEEMTGIPASAMLGKADYEYALPFYGERRPILIDLILQPREEVEKNYQILQWEQDVLIAETALPRPQGKAAYLLGKASFLYNRDGLVVGAIESIRDITKTRLAEKALRESEELHRSLFLASPDGIAVADNTGNIIYTSPRALELCGLQSPDEAIGSNIIDWIVPEDRPRAIEKFHSLIAGAGRVLGEEYSVLRKDGSVFPAAVNGSPLYGSDGEIRGMVGIIRDITRRRNAERALRESEEKFRTVIEQSMDGIIIVDFSGILLFANPGAGRIIESERYQHLVGKANVLDFVTPEFRGQAEKDFARVVAGIENFLVTYQITTTARNSIWIECIGRKITFGNRPAMLLSLRDITRRKLVEDALKKANEKLNLLSSITRHDIANTLLTLDADIVMLGQKIEDNPEAAGMLERIRKKSRKISEQIQFTKDYQDLGMNEPVWQNIATIVKTAAYENLPHLVSLEIQCDDYEIFADPMLMTVFYNILDNAKRHGETVSKITVTFSESGNSGVLVIRDNGVGVPEDIRDRIFEKGVGKNTGFGLFLAREILAITGLSIRETGAPGSGARFEISVPPGRWRRGPGEQNS